MIFGSSKDGEVPAVLVYDTLCERYGWTIDDVDNQLERHPKLFGELLHTLDAKGRKMAKDSPSDKRAESNARRRRLGVI